MEDHLAGTGTIDRSSLAETPSSSINLRRHYLLALAVAAAVYFASVAPGVLWQDSGMAQVRVLRGDYVGNLGLALAHPLFYMVAHVFQFLPFHDSALKTNLVSATASAFAVANLYLLLLLMFADLPHRRLSAAIGALTLGLAHTFWQHAALAETYNLSAMILSTELLLLYRFSQTFECKWYLGAWFLNGVECSNHMLATLTLAAIGIWSVVLIWRGRLRWYWLAAGIGLWIVGNLPYEFLILKTYLAGMPLAQVIHSALFGNYQQEVLNTTITPRLIVMAIGVVGLNFPTPNILLIPLGMLRGFRIAAKPFVLLLGLATFFHLLFALRYNIVDQYTFFILPILFLSIWLAMGAGWLLAAVRTAAVPRLLLVFALLPPVVYAPLPAAVERLQLPVPGLGSRIPYRDEARYFLWPWKTGYDNPARLALDVFEMAEPNAVVVPDSTSRHPFVYYQRFEGLRPDIEVTTDPCLQEPGPQRAGRMAQLLKDRPVYVVRPQPSYCPGYILDHFDLIPAEPIHRVLPSTQPPPATNPATGQKDLTLSDLSPMMTRLHALRTGTNE